ncbi:MAG: hypothetical protein A2Y53_08195 [Chloroflexi bacterium RBG_16_47_49]|nr:MAG: hypothetical protein A2Y53_08195 [Chloroflexi bacterium RBG_16_47_49]
MSDIKDQIFQNVTGSMDIFKKIASKIPGFKGYIERQNRRDSDKLIRDTIYRRFRELEGRVSDLQVEFINQGEIKYVDDLEKAALRLRTFADRVRTAPRGYSSLFEAVKVNEEELAKLYEYDATLLDKSEEIGRSIDNIQASVGTDGLPAAIRNLQALSKECVKAYERRQEVVALSNTEK